MASGAIKHADSLGVVYSALGDSTPVASEVVVDGAHSSR
jgi:hypothetical protein